MKGASSQSLKVQWGLETRRDAATDRGARGSSGRGRMPLAPLPPPFNLLLVVLIGIPTQGLGVIVLSAHS